MGADSLGEQEYRITKNVRRAVALSVCLLGACGTAYAQAPVSVDVPEIVTDRPDFTESGEIIPFGWLQIESGVSLEGDAVTRAFTAPSALLRFGLGLRTEFRFGAEGLVSESVGNFRQNGGSDLELGAKIRLLDADRAGIDLAVLPMVSLPTGTDHFTSGGVDPTLKITWARDLPSGFGLTGNFNLSSLTEDGQRFHQRAISVSLGHDLFMGWGGYAEAYGFSKMSATEGAGITVNGGVSRLLGRRMQIDIEAGRGVTAAAPDWFVGCGFAVIAPSGVRR
jgi:hypothetical protein